MNDDSTLTEVLIRYLDGELSAGEAARLEQEVEQTPVLKERLETLRAAKKSLRLYALREQVKRIHGEMASEYRRPAPVVKIRRMVLRAAASIMVVASLAAIYEYRQLAVSSLYNDSYRPYVITQIRGNSDSGTLAAAFTIGNNNEVIRIFRSLPEPRIQDYFLAGNAFLNTGDATSAIQAFMTLQKMNEQAHTHELEEDNDYYLAMSYLKNGDIPPALALFEKIHNDPGHLYHDKVTSWWLFKLRWAH